MKLQAFAMMILLGVGSSAMAATSPADQCQAAKTKANGDYVDCRQTAEAKFLKTGDQAKLEAAVNKCGAKLATAYTKAETKAGGACPTTGDAETVQALATQCGDALAASVETGGAAPACGDGAVNATGEHCDGTDLGGASCTSLSYDLGDLGCTAGCKFEASGCTSCPAGHIGCDSTCVDARFDEQNCGSCGNVCGAEQYCDNGGCYCANSLETDCDGACVDLQTDLGNCGGCGVTCEGDEVCVNGTCEIDAGGGGTCDYPGVVYAGKCWFATGFFQNCSQRCAVAGKSYDPATLTIGGYGGTNEACAAVLNAVGQSGGGIVDQSCESQKGCHLPYQGGGGFVPPVRCSAPTEPGDDGGPYTRVCACR
ncbi:MAG TPA: hypothetical protein VEB21_12350 [Terriglobales bacterium]|nr:hypothetical protein [Terriglobales bacterium]